MHFHQWKRREFISLLGGATAWPLAARAQQPGRVYRIGFLGGDPAIRKSPTGLAFVDGLRDNGFVDGKNVLIDWRFSEGSSKQSTALASALVHLQMDLIVGSGILNVKALKEATKTVPIVMLNIGDPISLGVVASLASPEGNITGVVQDVSPEIAGKLLQLLKDTSPHIARVAVLIDSDDPWAQAQWPVLENAARSLDVTLQLVETRAGDLERAFQRMSTERADALFLSRGGALLAARKLIIDLANRNSMAVVSHWREITEAGGLISYGANRQDLFRRAALYAAKILKGAKPVDLPIEQPTAFDFVINLKTARSLGFSIPPSLLLIADEVIE